MFSDQGGYYKFPNGLIMQWGFISIENTSTTSVNFPIKFPNKVLQVLVSPVGPLGANHSDGTQWLFESHDWSQTGFSAFVWDNVGMTKMSYLAIGY